MSGLAWSYAINQFTPHQIDRFVRRDEQERAFKILSALGFRHIELQAGTTRWDPLGRPELIALSYGSLDGFRRALSACGIDGVSTISWDPSSPAEEDGWALLSTRVRDDRRAIVEAARPFIDALPVLGGHTLVCRATEAFDVRGPLSESDIEVVAETANAVGEAARASGVTVALDLDVLSAFRGTTEISTLLELTDPDTVGLSIDTGDVTISRHDARHLVSAFRGRLRHMQFKDVVDVDDRDEYRLPGAQRALLLEGGSRGVERWFYELGVEGGRVDLPGIAHDLIASDFEGWVVVETQFGPAPAEIAMMNSWYIQNHLDPLFRPRPGGA